MIDIYFQMWMTLACSTETSENLCHSTQRHVPEARNVQTQHYVHSPPPNKYCLIVPVEESLTHSPPESNRTDSSFHLRSLQFARHSDLDIAVSQTEVNWYHFTCM